MMTMRMYGKKIPWPPFAHRTIRSHITLSSIHAIQLISFPANCNPTPSRFQSYTPRRAAFACSPRRYRLVEEDIDRAVEAVSMGGHRAINSTGHRTLRWRTAAVPHRPRSRSKSGRAPQEKYLVGLLRSANHHIFLEKNSALTAGRELFQTFKRFASFKTFCRSTGARSRRSIAALRSSRSNRSIRRRPNALFIC
jgi:hypothetical protein